MYCQKCGKENYAESKFCVGCGVSLESETAPGGVIIAADKKSHKNIIIVGIVVAAAAVLSAVFGIVKLPFLNNSPAEAMKTATVALYEGNLAGFKKFLSTSAVQKMDAVSLASDPSQLMVMMRQMSSSKKGIKGIDVLKEDINGNTANVCLKVTFGDGTSDNGGGNCANMVRENGEWKVDFANF